MLARFFNAHGMQLSRLLFADNIDIWYSVIGSLRNVFLNKTLDVSTAYK